MEGRAIRRSRRWVWAQNRGKRLLGMWPFLRVLTFEHMIFNDLSMQNALAAYIAISLLWPGRDCRVLPKKGVWNLCSFMDFMDDKVYSKRCIKKEWHDGLGSAIQHVIWIRCAPTCRGSESSHKVWSQNWNGNSGTPHHRICPYNEEPKLSNLVIDAFAVPQFWDL